MLTLTVFANLRCSTTASSGTLLPSGSTIERRPRRDVDPELRPPLQVLLGLIRGRQVAYPHLYQLRRSAAARE